MNKPQPYRTRAQVQAYLQSVKGLISGRRWHLEPRNRQAVLDLDLTLHDVEDALLGLKVDDYCRGPEPDRDVARPGDIWIFVAVLRGIRIEIYVKLKTDPAARHLTVLSFHRPMHPIRRHFQP